MAPLKGITDTLFRRIFTRHFDGVDLAIAPFINPQSAPPYSDKLIGDVLPENNDFLPLIPQIINSEAEGFVSLANRLSDIGYPEINWNLGCPVRMVAAKRRGSGLLPYPEQIVELLDRVIPRLKPRLSIKMRLGYHDCSEALNLLPRLESYPLSEITIHARLGVQLYRGAPDLERFEQCAALTTHRLVYNGDIVSIQGFIELQQRFKKINHWMIGRGLLINPFLAAEIKGAVFSAERRNTMLWAFHDELFAAFKMRLSGPGHLLGRMKQVWTYFISAFPDQQKRLKKITRTTSEKNYLKAVDQIFGG